MAAALETNTARTTLYLPNNRICAAGATALAAALVTNTALAQLDLGEGNSIGDTGLAARDARMSRMPAYVATP